MGTDAQEASGTEHADQGRQRRDHGAVERHEHRDRVTRMPTPGCSHGRTKDESPAEIGVGIEDVRRAAWSSVAGAEQGSRPTARPPAADGARRSRQGRAAGAPPAVRSSGCAAAGRRPNANRASSAGKRSLSNGPNAAGSVRLQPSAAAREKRKAWSGPGWTAAAKAKPAQNSTPGSVTRRSSAFAIIAFPCASVHRLAALAHRQFRGPAATTAPGGWRRRSLHVSTARVAPPSRHGRTPCAKLGAGRVGGRPDKPLRAPRTHRAGAPRSSQI